MRDNSDSRIVEKIFQHADLCNKHVLEVGCGDGRITSLLTGKPEVLIAIEPDKEKIRQAGKNVSGADFRIGYGEKMDFPDEHFDLVLFTLSLHHQDSEAAIGEAMRVLKQEGRVVVIEPINEGEVEKVFALVHDENEDTLNAQQSIKKSGLILESSELFCATWVFESKEELSRSIFEYFGKPFEFTSAKEMYDLLGAKSEDQPIELLDIMVIQSLKKDRDDPFLNGPAGG